MRLSLKIIALTSLMLVCLILLVGCKCNHEYDDATCISGKVCKICGHVEGEPNVNEGHKWGEATCLVDVKCELCGKSKGSKLGHNWTQATCESPMKCTRCNATNGAAKGHLWINATCDKPKTCDNCGKTSGAKLGHSWVAATCTYSKFCSRCRSTTGSPLGHNWVDATCTSPKTCKRCNEEQGTSLGHLYLGGSCGRCGVVDNSFFKVSNTYATYSLLGIKTVEIKAYNVSYEVSGTTLIITFDIKKTYDLLGSKNSEDYVFKWKLTNKSNVVIDSGSLRTESLRKNEYDEGFQIVIKDIDLTKKYEFCLISDSLSPW